jgi:HD-like signal output (HDOD) protein
MRNLPEKPAAAQQPGTAAVPVCLLEGELPRARELASALGFGTRTAVTVFDAADALLEHLSRHACHVAIVADDLPDSGCAAVLRRVQTRYPEVIRVVLTDADGIDVFRRVPYAHQFFKRSAPASALCGALLQCVELRDLLVRPELRALVSSSNALPAAPKLYAELIDLLADPRCSMLKVVSVLERDVGMSTRLMQLVSSAFFGMKTQITSLGACVGYLGLDAIRSLVLSAEISQLYPGSVPGLTAERVHSRALSTSRLARRLAGSMADPGHAFIAGLLHGVGQLVLASRAPVEFGEALEACSTRGLTQTEAELERLGATSAQVGAYLLALWGQPLEVVRAIAYQDLPEICDSERPGLATVIYLSKRLSNDADVPLGPATTSVAALNEAFLTNVGALERLVTFRETARRLAS